MKLHQDVGKPRNCKIQECGGRISVGNAHSIRKLKLSKSLMFIIIIIIIIIIPPVLVAARSKA